MAAPAPQANASGEASSGTAPAASKPSGVVDGDLLIAQLSTRGGGPPTHTAPAGWTEVANQTNGTAIKVSWWYKVASGEGSSYTFGLSASARWILHLFRITGADATTPINVSAAGTSLTCPTVTTTVADCLLLRGVGEAAGSTGDPRTAPGSTTEQWNNTEGGSGGHWQGLATSVLAAAGASGTAAWSTAAGTNPVGGTIAIAPPASASVIYPQLERIVRGLNRGLR